MLVVHPPLTHRYEARLAQQNVMAGQRPHYHQWLHYDLDFCEKYSFAPMDRLKFAGFSGEIAGQASAGILVPIGRVRRIAILGDDFPIRCQTAFSDRGFQPESSLQCTAVFIQKCTRKGIRQSRRRSQSQAKALTLKEAKSPLDL